MSDFTNIFARTLLHIARLRLPRVAFLVAGMVFLAANAVANPNVTFSVRDFLSRDFTNKSLTITPIGGPFIDGTNVVSGQSYTTNTGNGTFTISNMVSGTYSVSLFGNPVTRWIMTVPNDSNDYSASALVVVNPPGFTTIQNALLSAKYVQHTNGNLVAPTNFFRSNIVAGSGVTITYDASGKPTIASTGSGGVGATNYPFLVATNYVDILTAPSSNSHAVRLTDLATVSNSLFETDIEYAHTNRYFRFGTGEVFHAKGSGLFLTNLIPDGAIRSQLPVPPRIVATYVPLLCNGTEEWVTNTMKALVSNGMFRAGWNHILVEDGQYLNEFDSEGGLKWNPSRYPNGPTSIVAQAHQQGFKIWNYISSSSGVSCCGTNNPGTPPTLLSKHIAQTLDWGFDGLMVDNCVVATNLITVDQMRGTIRTFNEVAFNRNAITTTSNTPRRGMALYMNMNDGVSSGFLPWESLDGCNILGLPGIGAITNVESIVAYSSAVLSNRYAIRPGNYYQLTSWQHGGQTKDHNRNILAAYSMLCVPMQIGTANYGYPYIDDLCNETVRAIHQDPAVIVADVITNTATNAIWFRPLGYSGSKSNAVVFWNKSTNSQTIALDVSAIGYGTNEFLTVKEAWTGVDLTNVYGTVSFTVPANNHAFFTLRSAELSPAIVEESSEAPSFSFNRRDVRLVNSNGALISLNADAGLPKWLTPLRLATLPSKFSPRDISPTIHYSASTLNLSNGFYVGGVRDLSTNKYHASPIGDTYGPIYVRTNGVINGQPWMEFQGTNSPLALGNALRVTNFAAPLTGTNTLFMVLRNPTSTNNGALMMLVDGGDTEIYYDNSQANSLFFNAGTQQVAAASQGKWQIVSVRFGGGNSYVKTNNVQSGSTLSLGTNAITELAIGANTALGQDAKFGLAEFILWNRELSSSEETNVFRYLNEIYGIYSDSVNPTTDGTLGGSDVVGAFRGITIVSNLTAPNLSATASGVALTNPTVTGTLGLNGDFVTGLYTNQGTNVGGVFTNVALFATNITAPNFSTTGNGLAGTNLVLVGSNEMNAATLRLTNGSQFIVSAGNVFLGAASGTNTGLGYISGGTLSGSLGFYSAGTLRGLIGNGYTGGAGGGFLLDDDGSPNGAGDIISLARHTAAGTWLVTTNLATRGYITPTNGLQWTTAHTNWTYVWPANTAGLYATNVSNIVEIYTADSAGNHTLQSPHATDSPMASIDDGIINPIVIRHGNAYIGVTEWIHLSAMAREIERLSGKKFIASITNTPPKDWIAEQAAIKAARDAERAALQAQSAAGQTNVNVPPEYIPIPEPPRVKAARKDRDKSP